MGAELGRVSGPLLANNLIRNGINLAFSNTDVSTPVFQLDVNNRRIGINNDSPTRELFVNSYAQTTNLIVDTSATFQNFNLATSTITHASDTIYIRPNQSSNPTVVVPGLQATNLLINNNTVTNTVENANIQLSPSGTGQVVTNGSVLVNGELHATGNITWDGDITLGNADTDNITFSADVNSSIVPNTDNAFALGGNPSTSKRWATLYTELVHSGNMIATNLTSANNLNPVLNVGSTRYVSVNGNDTLAGTHAHAPYLTLKAALTAAQPGDEIVIFPGTYTEIFPLTVPRGVSVRGAGIRSVTIQPTVGTKTQPAFLLQGDTTLEFFTVTGFYSNYAFRLAPNYLATARSPYLQNLTVITQGSVTSVNDPRGFNQGDAGGGAYVDGHEADLSNTITPAMLFHSVTMIVPNADGIVITNSARVEWLNSFTYFAKRSAYLYAQQNNTVDGGDVSGTSTGTLDGGDSSTLNLQSVDAGDSTTDYYQGAKIEFRSINSASVSGTYGIVGVGGNVVGYLVGHNFAYIGTNGSSTNDLSLVNQANEVITSDGATVYYESVDQLGNLRIGDVFSINQETGAVVIVAQAVNFTNGGSISLAGAGNTYIDAKLIETGNIVIHDNNIDSLAGPVNFHSYNGTTTWVANTFVTGNVDVTGNFSVEGNITVGNEAFDTVSILPRLGQTIKPDVTDSFSLGSSSVKWKDVYLTGTFDVLGNYTAGSWDLLTGYFEVPFIKIDGNTLSVTQADTDLNLQANGTGGVIFDKIKVTNTTISSVDANQSIRLSPRGADVTTAGAMNYSANGTSAYFFRVYGPLHNDPGHANFDQVQAGWTCDQILGAVVISNVPDLSDNNESCTITITGGTFVQNTFYTFSGAGSSNVVINTSKSLVLPVGSNSTRSLSTSGEIRFNSATTLFDGWQASGLVSFKDLYDSDRNTYVTAELTPGTNDNIIRFGVNGTVVGTIDTTKVYSNTLWGGNVRISNNNIDNISSSADVNIKPKRVGGNYTGVTLTRVVGSGAEFAITIEDGVYKTGENVVTAPGSGYDVGTTVILPGSFLSGISPDNNCYVKVLSVDSTGGITNAEVSFGLAVGTDGTYENNTQIGVTTGRNATFDITWAVDATSYTLTLSAPGTGYSTNERYIILGTQLGGTSPQNDIIFVINATAGAVTSIAQVQQGLPFSPSTGDVNFNNMLIRDNEIKTPLNGTLTLTNQDNGYVKFSGTKGLVLPAGTNAQRRGTPEVGELRYNTDIEYAEIYNGSFWQPVKGSSPELGVEDLIGIMEEWTLTLG